MTEIFGVPTQALLGQLMLGLVNGSFYAMLSLGLAVIFGMLNIVNFAHGALYMVGAFFAWMLLKKPGCYIWIGNGDGVGSCMVHNPGYDFNDEVLPLGASYWATLVEQQLAREALPQAAE